MPASPCPGGPRADPRHPPGPRPHLAPRPPERVRLHPGRDAAPPAPGSPRGAGRLAAGHAPHPAGGARGIRGHAGPALGQDRAGRVRTRVPRLHRLGHLALRSEGRLAGSRGVAVAAAAPGCVRPIRLAAQPPRDPRHHRRDRDQLARLHGRREGRLRRGLRSGLVALVPAAGGSRAPGGDVRSGPTGAEPRLGRHHVGERGLPGVRPGCPNGTARRAPGSRPPRPGAPRGHERPAR